MLNHFGNTKGYRTIEKKRNCKKRPSNVSANQQLSDGDVDIKLDGSYVASATTSFSEHL